MYDQKREIGDDETKWPHRLLGGRHITEAHDIDGKSIRLVVESIDSDSENSVETLEVDLVVAATGYKRTAHVDLLKDLWPLLPPSDKSLDLSDSESNLSVISATVPGTWEVSLDNQSRRVLSVSRDYRVQFTDNAVAQDSGVWLQGCCEGTHGVSLNEKNCS